MSAFSETLSIQDLGMLYEEDCAQVPDASIALSAADGLVRCIREKGVVDLPYISRLTGLSFDRLTAQLRDTGAIFQDPGVFSDEDEWEITKGWLLRASYLCGSIPRKYAMACDMDRRFPGCFSANIAALKAMLPAGQPFEDIYISLGASWIPAEEYACFVRDLLQLKTRPRIFFNKELAVWKIETPAEAKYSLLNTHTYGTADISAIRILEQTMNARTVKIYDTVFPIGSFESQRVFNPTKTLAAQEKQKAILQEFEAWTKQDILRRNRLEEYYNEAFSGYAYTPYDGDFLDFDDLNPDISLYKHQRDAIARIVLSGENVLLAHDVGTGKTYEMIIGIHELYRMGISKKNLLVVPNNVLQDFAEAHARLYPGDKILVVYPKDFSVQKRGKVLEDIRDGDYTAVYLSHSSFDLILMSKDYHIRKQTARIRQLRSAAAVTANAAEKHMLDVQADREAKKLAKFRVNYRDCPWLSYDRLGIETLVVDEAHNYKNIPMDFRADGIGGIHKKGSEKCAQMLEKVHNTDRVIFATGTPITNSLADVFVLQKYLQPELLKFRGLLAFDQWLSTFAQRETNWEMDVDSSGLREVTRFSSFHNLGELMCLFSLVCDFHYLEEKGDNLPAFRGGTDICVPCSEPQKTYIQELSHRTEAIRSRQVDRTEDNLLKVTTDGRKAALDIRLVEPDAEIGDGDSTKIEACALQVVKLYHAWPGDVQLVFSDIGTPRQGFNVYDALRIRLTRLGIPGQEIAFVHEATGEAARARMFRAVNEGSLRVVIGSTQKLGVGVNVQQRLRAIHHLSVPWRPADLIQREGRMIRKGNICDEVFVYRYITERTFDSYSWQLLENKQRFISSFLSGSCGLNQVEDVADMVLSYAEIKALAIGNPLIKKRVEVANTISRKKMASRQRQKQLTELRAVIDGIPEKQKKLKTLARFAAVDAAVYRTSRESVSREERMAFGEELLEALRDNRMQPKERFFFSYQGFDVLLPPGMNPETPFVILRGRSGGTYRLAMDTDKPLGCCMRMDHLLDGLEQRVRDLQERVLQLEQRKAQAHADLDGGNPYLAQIDALTQTLRRIDKELEQTKEAETA